MPYENEYAHYKPLRRIVESERVEQLLRNYKIQEISSDTESTVPLTLVTSNDLERSSWKPDWVLAIDGSKHEVAIKNGYPGAEAAYITVASVLIDAAKIRKLDEQRPIDPRDFRTIEQAESLDCALPGCNVVYDGEISAKASMRRALYEILAMTSLDSDTETLLDTYEALLEYKPTKKDQKCPYEDNCPIDGQYVPQSGVYSCNCSAGHRWYSTDALRIHERMNPSGTNGMIFSEIMQVLEQLWLIHILRVFEAQNLLSTLRKIAIVMDGPLAVFGQPAWLSAAIFEELSRLNVKIRKATGGIDILLLGIEKSGLFVNHFGQIDTYPDGTMNRFPNGTAALLSDDYIKQHLIFSDSNRPYGYATYFGRKFFYKTQSGAMIVGSLPFLTGQHKDLNDDRPEQFPRLADAISVIEQLVSSRYTNALTPLVSAHAEAAIPLHLGNRILAKIARDIINENYNGQ